MSSLGIDTPEERQQARAAYQKVESFLPMVAPPASVIFPTPEDRKRDKEQTDVQMGALFTGA